MDDTTGRAIAYMHASGAMGSEGDLGAVGDGETPAASLEPGDLGRSSRGAAAGTGGAGPSTETTPGFGKVTEEPGGSEAFGE